MKGMEQKKKRVFEIIEIAAPPATMSAVFMTLRAFSPL